MADKVSALMSVKCTVGTWLAKTETKKPVETPPPAKTENARFELQHQG